MKKLRIRNADGRMIGQVNRIYTIRKGHLVLVYQAVCLMGWSRAEVQEFERALPAARWIQRTSNK